jgi:hypothetical protein
MTGSHPVTPGLYRWPSEAYHADPCPEPSLSSGLARLILNRSPLHAWTASPRLNPAYEPTESAAFDIGRAVHRAVLGIGDDYVAYPEELLASNGAATTKAAREWADEQRAAGRTPLKADVVDQIGEIAEAVSRRLGAMKITLDPRRSEIVALAKIDGVWCRAMIDNAPEDQRQPLYDIKTCQDASISACIRAVATYGYDVQAAHYLDVWKAATGEDRRFRFIFVEKTPPYEVAVVELCDAPGDTADWMVAAREKIGEARRVWGECLATNRWPGYPPHVALIGAPAWHTAAWIDRPQRPESPRAETIARATAWQAPMEE